MVIQCVLLKFNGFFFLMITLFVPFKVLNFTVHHNISIYVVYHIFILYYIVPTLYMV